MARRGHAHQEPTHCRFNVLSGNEDAHDASEVIFGLHSAYTFLKLLFINTLGVLKVEPGGVEPPSKQGHTVISTCLFCN